MAQSDWELVPNSAGSPSASAPSSQSDWEVVPNAPQSRQPQRSEGFGQALVKAPFRVLEDTARAGMGLLKDIPGYIQSAKTEIPGMGSAIRQHPGHAALQALAGSQELVNNLAQLPKNLAQYGAGRLNLLPQGAANFVAQITPQDTTGAINELFDQPKYEGEKLLRGIPRNALNVYGLGKIGSKLNPMNLSAKNIAKDVLNTAEKNKKIYSQKYDSVWNEAKQKGISDLSNISPYLDIDTLREFTPKKKIVGVEEFVKSPTLENAHRAKSDLLALDRKLNDLTTMNSGERKHAVAVKNAIADLQDNMFRTPLGEVDSKLANKYNAIQKGYATEVIPYKNKAINKFKQGKMSAKELVNALSSGEFAAMRGKHHPALGIRNMSPFARNASLIGLGLGAGGIGKAFYDDVTDTKEPQ